MNSDNEMLLFSCPFLSSDKLQLTMKKLTLTLVAMMALAVTSLQAQTKEKAPPAPTHDNHDGHDHGHDHGHAHPGDAHAEMDRKRAEGMEAIMRKREDAMVKMEKGEITEEQFNKINEDLHKEEMKLHEPPAPHDAPPHAPAPPKAPKN